ncbi:hypothetical protein ACEXQD_03180 [Herbiconiux sp. P15]|uniref:hypothetical protein n=1 Tax=Herbiconiux liukaitaii TaxID=3342799 RepID=UPI0035B6BC59
MKSSEWKRIVRHALPDQSKWAFRGTLCYAVPVGRVLFGVAMQNSRDPECMYISRIAMPLFIPTTVVYGGERIRGKDGQIISVTEDLEGLLHPVLSAELDESLELRKMVSVGASSVNRLLQETAGYAELLQGNVPAARQILRSIQPPPGDSRAFVLEMFSRVRMVVDLLDQGSSAAIGQLDKWVGESAGNLGLSRVR